MVVENKEVMQIKRFLIANGFRPNLKGFTYAVDCIHALVLSNGRHIKMEELYHDTAEFYGDTRSNVERGIRFLIKKRNDDEDSPVKGMSNSTAVYSLHYAYAKWQEGNHGGNNEGDNGMAYN